MPAGKFATVLTPQNYAARLRPSFEACGYGEGRLAEGYAFDGHTVALAGFATRPWDTRTACLAAVNGAGDSQAAAATCSELAAPAVFVCDQDGVDWWRMTVAGPADPRRLSWADAPQAIATSEELAPLRIYEAKLRRGKFVGPQMWFFDVGLMPAVEGRIGLSLTKVVEDTIVELKEAVRSVGGKRSPRSERQFQEDVYRTVFWFLAAKVLHDKQVPNFVKIDLTDPEDVFDRIGKHHGETDRYPPFGKAGRAAVEAAARTIAQRGSLSNVSSESLAFVYENALIDPNTGKTHKAARGRGDIRRELGIHSTPPVLVDHILSELWPLIREVPAEDRHVFEPACGHAPFLVAALRWLRDFDNDLSAEERHAYLKRHLHGIEADPFAVEVAKLSLLLADVPHGNRWDIATDDMFAPRALASRAGRARVLLANPPYESFTPEQRETYAVAGRGITAQTKVVEVLARVLPATAAGTVFGFVVPQGLLHDGESVVVRRFLADQCELSEIAVFSDNLFEHGDHEVAVVLGRRVARAAKGKNVWVRRVRERGMPAFKERMAFSSERLLPQSSVASGDSYVMAFPDLPELWSYLSSLPPLEACSLVLKGREYWEEGKLDAKGLVSNRRRPGWTPVILTASAEYTVMDGPPAVWIDPRRSAYRRPGANPGHPQVVLNYAPKSRGPWRLVPFVDSTGIGVSSRFVVFRPKPGGPPLRMLWAALLSPVANAYAFCHSGKRQTLVKEWRAFPFPSSWSEHVTAIEAAASDYLTTLETARESFMKPSAPAAIRRALLALDAEVLRMYDLPPRLERELLDLFSGVERKGVGCEFREYFPAAFHPFVPLHEYLSHDYERSTAGNVLRRLRTAETRAAIDALDRTERLIHGD